MTSIVGTETEQSCLYCKGELQPDGELYKCVKCGLRYTIEILTPVAGEPGWWQNAHGYRSAHAVHYHRTQVCPRCRGEMQTQNGDYWDCAAGCGRRVHGTVEKQGLPYFDDERTAWSKEHPWEPLRAGMPWGDDDVIVSAREI